MQAYQAVLPDIQELGGQMVAISPQQPDNSLSAQEKWELEFQVLSDVGNAVAREYGLVYRLPEDTRWVFENFFNTELPEYNGDDSWELPLPGTYVVSQAGEISYAFIDPDHTKRAEPDELVAAVRAL